MDGRRRAFVVVLDAVGAGALPDAADYGDAGTNTLAHVADAVGGLELPTLARLGLGNVTPIRGVPPAARPAGPGGPPPPRARQGTPPGPPGGMGGRAAPAPPPPRGLPP